MCMHALQQEQETAWTQRHIWPQLCRDFKTHRHTAVFTDPSWRSSQQKRLSGTCRIISLQFCNTTLQVFNTGISIMLSSEGRKVQSSNRLEYHRQFILYLPRLSPLQHTPPEGSSSSQFCASNLEGFGGRDKGSSVHLFSMKPAITCLLRMLSLLPGNMLGLQKRHELH